MNLQACEFAYVPFFAWSSFQVRSNIWCFFAWSSFQARSNIWCRSFEKTRFRSFHRYVDKWGMKFENLQMFNSTNLFIVTSQSALLSGKHLAGLCMQIWFQFMDFGFHRFLWKNFRSSLSIQQLKKRYLYVYWNILCLIWYNFLRRSLMILGIMLLLQVVLFRLMNNDFHETPNLIA